MSITFVFNVPPNLMETTDLKTYLSIVYHGHVYFSSILQYILFWETMNLPKY